MSQNLEPQAQPLEFTGERYVPEIYGNIELEHLHRYLFAAQFTAQKVVVDIACGEGYGSFFLSLNSKKTVGVDISTEAVNHAKSKYSANNLEFKVGSCSAIPSESGSVDVVVSFETIEHHAEHEAMMREIKRILKPGGLLVISSPDKKEYSDVPGYSNPFHVKELYRQEFKDLLGKYFKNHNISGQRIIYGSAILGEERAEMAQSFSLEDPGYTAASGIGRPIYFLAVASDSELPLQYGGMLEQLIWKTDYARSLHIQIAELTSRNSKLQNLEEQLSGRNLTIQKLEEQLRERNLRLLDKGDRVSDLQNKLLLCETQLQSLREIESRLKGVEGELADLRTSKFLRLKSALIEPFSLNKLWKIFYLCSAIITPKPLKALLHKAYDAIRS